MIRELSVKNLALIEDLTVEFDRGFSIFTGETGAGKSILIGAIGLLLGDRASSEMVRSGAEEAEVTGVFELDTIPTAVRALAEQSGVRIEENALVVRRRIAVSGKNRVHLNDQPVQLSLLKEIGDHLVDFHSQHEHQSLLKPETAYAIVDGLPRVAPACAAYREAFVAFTHARERLDEHMRTAAELAQKRDFLEFQHKELSSMNLREGEEDELESQLRLLSTVADRTRCITEIQGLLTDGDNALSATVGRIAKRLEVLSKHDPSVADWLPDVQSAATTFSELETFCGSYGEKILGDADPARIEEINARLARIQRMRKKYGMDVAALIRKQAEVAADLLSFENVGADEQLLRREHAAAEAACRAKGELLAQARMKACEDFDRRVGRQMISLGFTGGKWKTSFSPVPEPRETSLEEIEFTVQTNPGEPFLSLIKTASGGEISRLMLAIKSVVAEHDRIPVLIFDEIDTGIGGVLANEVGKAMQSLAQSHQVICITHLHQIASLARHHYRVYKEVSAKRTVTRVARLSHADKVIEIARMLGGESEITLQHARQLLGER